MRNEYKTVRNGRGTSLEIGPEAYIRVGKGGEDVMIRGGGTVAAFDTWDGLTAAIAAESSACYQMVWREEGTETVCSGGGCL